MNIQYPMPYATVFPAGETPPGWKRRGLVSPSGVNAPPPGIVEAQEIQYVRALNGQSNANPSSTSWTEYLDKNGATQIWKEFAKEYRHQAGFVRGWLGTGLMAVAMGVTAINTKKVKGHYGRLRPYQVDGTIKPIGKAYTDPAYPSGHTSAAFAAATVLSHLWPQRAHEYNWWARQVGLSRMAAGMHFPSDVATGAELGTRIGTTAASIMY